VAVGRTAVYLAYDNVLLARSLADGKLLWKRRVGAGLPRPYATAAGWQVRRAGGCLVVWSRQADWLRWSWLPAGPFAAAAPLRAALGRPLPVLIHRPRDGKLLQRFDFPTTVPRGTVQFLPGRLVVGVPGSAWGVAPEAGKGEGRR
jgi:hypothetical protein